MRDQDQIGQAVRALRAGRLVAFPTETVYGLGANALDSRAVARIFEVKQRPLFNPLIVHVTSLEEASEVASEIPELARVLASRFWPGPLTIVVPKRAVVPDLVTAGLSTVAIRVPSHPVAQALLREARVPIAAPSANRFTSLSPTRAEDVREVFGEEFMILDGGPCAVGLESTIVGFGPTGRPRILRTGGLPAEEIERLVGPVTYATSSRTPESPGQLDRHYSPRTRLYWEKGPDPHGLRLGLLSFGRPPDAASFAACEVLSESTDLREAAANLYGCLRRLDRLGLDGIVARPVPETGLGRAINDRLKRASQ